MAGYLGSFAGGAIQHVEDFASQQAKAFEESPLDYLIKVLWEYGLILIAAGILMSLLGFVLRTHGTRAANDEAAFLQQEAAIFDNLTGPPAPGPLSWNIGQDVTTVAGDIANDAVWVGSTVVNAVQDIGTAIWNGLRNVPRLIWDDLQIVAGFTLGNGLDFVFPFCIIGGTIMVAVSLVLRFVRSEILPRVTIAGRARWETWVSQPLDRLFGTAKDLPVAVEQAQTEVAIETAGADDAAIAATAPTALPEAPSPTPGPTGADVGNEGIAVDEAGGVRETAPAEPVPEKPTPEPTEKVEDELGVSYTEAKDRMRAALWKRDHPEPPAPPPPEPEPTFEESIEEQGEAEQESAEDEMRRALEARDEMAAA